MKRSRQMLVLGGTLLIALTLIFADRVQSQSAFDQLRQLGGSVPSVPDVPPPTYDDEGTEDAWDVSDPGWRQWKNNQASSSAASQAELMALKQQQQSQQRLLEEAQRKQQEEAQRRHELEQFWQQVVTQQKQEQAQQMQQEAERQRAFEQAKQTLLVNFRVPSASDIESPEPITTAETTVTWSTCGRASFGQVATAAQGLGGGLSAAQWQRARQYQGVIETLYQSGEREPEDEAILAQVEAGRNKLWTKAVSVPELPDDAREALTLPLPVTLPQNPVPEMTHRDIQRVEIAAKMVKEASEKTVPKLLDCINTLASVSMPESELMSGTINKYGNLLAASKITMAAAKGGASSAIAESVDFVIGTIPLPQTTTALAGGRMYANVAFQATDRFMTDAMKATGGTFDSKAFWNDFTSDLNVWQKAVMEFVHYGPQN